MSYAASIVGERGMLALFVPHHDAAGLHVEDWNRSLAREVDLVIRRFRPSVLVYDATVVFGGVLDAMAQHPGMATLWVRRTMWREKHRASLDLSGRFDAIVEPEDLADDLDAGPTRERRREVMRVPPILHVDPEARLDRDAARRELGLDPSATVIALQLGSGTNLGMDEVRRAAIDAILAEESTTLFEVRSPIAALHEPSHRRMEPRLREAALFPAFRYSQAFDGAVSAAGYNGFHEAVLGAVPTLFVPNEAEDMDLQLNRARWAAETGRGWLVRLEEGRERLASGIGPLLDAARRNGVAARCREVGRSNGAGQVAAWIQERAEERA